MDSNSLVEFLIFGTGIGGVMLNQWRSSVGVKNKVENQNGWLQRLTRAVEKQNGRIHNIEITCAKTHGIDPSQVGGGNPG